jgi:hypothetical protein
VQEIGNAFCDHLTDTSVTPTKTTRTENQGETADG